ncbi:hypothetical protein FHT39_000516 [Mitsuaria sp. BK045]|uniref:Z1 domain-containing protein n=1 Tax=unclassified Roseateles TaxID=2626991 RepID=UPI001619C709|nr:MULTISPECIES: Z1 domain-containing protein [unclassified Roseateles]MBB3291877.1 hypothetical protein [Mitsuaria sp. BK041]MBB3361094.1 hypothetical protein [Mitsuaria sp. BK045]
MYDVDPLMIAVGMIGSRQLTDELLSETLEKLRIIFPHLGDQVISEVRRQLEGSLGVVMKAGQGLHDGDIAPWVQDAKSSIVWEYWRSYVRQLQSKGQALDVIRVLDEDTDNVLTECGDPRKEGPWLSKGLVMGDVQSGKTSNYCGLIAKAADAGYKVIVLLTGTIEDLRAQSQERLDEGFVGRDSRQLLRREKTSATIGAGRFRTKIPNVLTSIDSDFLTANKQVLGGIPLENLKEPVLLVVKKNSTALGNLVEFLDSQKDAGKIQVPLLVVDDEADNASVNAKKDDNPATINRLIRELLQKFSRTSYVAYTATPFANVFIDPDLEDLFPSNFVYSLNAPSTYRGVGSFFVEGGATASGVRDIVDAAAILPYGHKIDHPISELPKSLQDAVDVFLLSCAIRDLRDEPLKHRSMLVNATRFSSVQERIAEKLKEYLYRTVEDVKQYLAADEVWQGHPPLVRLHELWEEHFADCGKSWDSVRHCLYDAISSVKVVTVNKNTEKAERLNYSAFKDTRLGRRVIAVGGLTLSRGLTLEGLCVSYFYRNSKAYDTLLQMGRWFGYRPGYEDLCRIWADPQAQDWYAHLADVVAKLRFDIQVMHANGLPPRKFGMKVLAHPNALVATAAAKMRHSDEIEIKVSFSGAGVETPLLPADGATNERNLEELERLLRELPTNFAFERGRYYWQGIDRSVVSRFLGRLEILELNPHFMREMETGQRPLLNFIANADLEELEKWDLAIPQGSADACNISLLSPISGRSEYLRPRMRQFEKVSKGTGFLRLNKQRVGEISDEQVGLLVDEEAIAAAWETKKLADPQLGKTIPGWFYRSYRKRPLLTIHLVQPAKREPKEPKVRADGKVIPPREMMDPADIEPSILLALSISFPGYAGKEETVVYSLNKVALRQIGLLDEADDDED